MGLPAPKRLSTAGELVAGGVHVANGVLDVAQQILSLRHHPDVADAVCELECAPEGGACATELSLGVPHQSRSVEDSAFGTIGSIWAAAASR
jgi:hypothetical protein